MLVSGVFIVIMVIVGSITTEYELMLIVTMQKVFSYTGTICGFFICYGAWKLEKTDKKN